MLFIYFKGNMYTEIQKTHEAAGRGGLICGGFVLQGFFESHIGLFSFVPDVKKGCRPFTIAW